MVHFQCLHAMRTATTRPSLSRPEPHPPAQTNKGVLKLIPHDLSDKNSYRSHTATNHNNKTGRAYSPAEPKMDLARSTPKKHAAFAGKARSIAGATPR